MMPLVLDPPLVMMITTRPCCPAAMCLHQVSLCPQCRQANAKVNNNNHIGCWACGAHHCYLCRKILGGGAKDRSGGRHFSTKGCKQHTSD